MLAFKLLLRNWRSGELKLLGISLVLAVAVVSSIAIFTARLETTISAQANSILGADAIVGGTLVHDPQWQREADRLGIAHTQASTLDTMVYAGDSMLLSSVKAVANGFPLRGKVKISTSVDTKTGIEAEGIPKRGQAWVDARLLSELGLQLGDTVFVGELELQLSRVVLQEPTMFARHPRLLMNLADLPASQLVELGSRVYYDWQLASDDAKRLQQFKTWLEPQLSEHQQITDIASLQKDLQRVVTNSSSFLLLTAVIAALLAGIAIAVVARQFATRQIDQVALIKSLGVSASRIRWLYVSQLLLLGLAASLLGLLIGHGLHYYIATSLQEIYQMNLVKPGVFPYLISQASGLLCLLFFALPALWFLPGIPPMKILRRELSIKTTKVWLQAVLAFVVVLELITMFSQKPMLALSVVGALFAVVILCVLLALLLLKLAKLSTKHWGANKSAAWRLAIANILKNKWQNMLLILVFSISIMLLLTLTLIRGSLINQWASQFPENGITHALINVPADSVEKINVWLNENSELHEPLTPIVRGRISHINGEKPSEILKEQAQLLQWEHFLTWSRELKKNESLLSGHWWREAERESTALPFVSVTVWAAENMGVKVGDEITFLFSGLPLVAKITSLREFGQTPTVQNFTFVFEPGALNDFIHTYQSAFYLPPERSTSLNALIKDYPTILVLDLSKQIKKIRTTINQVGDAVNLVLWLALAGGCLVLISVITSSLDARKQETGLLRAFGASKRLMLGSVWIEFTVLGCLSGVIAVAGAECLLMSLQVGLLKIDVQPHYLYWLFTPLSGALLIGVFGMGFCRSAVATPPGVVLREAT